MSEETTTLVGAQSRDITYAESVWALDGDLARSTVVQAVHALDLGKSHKVAILQAVPGLIQCRHQTIFINIGDNATNRLFASRIADREILAEIIEDVAEKTERIRNRDIDAVLVAEVCNRQLLLQRSLGQNYRLIALQLFQIFNKILALMNCHGDIGVELGDSWCGDFGTRLADIMRLQEELGGEICDGNGSRVVEGKRLDTGEGNVLG